MPQNPLGAYVAVNVSNAAAPLKLDSSGNLKVSQSAPAGGTRLSALHVTVSTVVKAGAGTLNTVLVTQTAGKKGQVYDALTLTGAVVGNLIMTLNSGTIGASYADLGFPFANGLVVVPGSGQALSLSYQ